MTEKPEELVSFTKDAHLKQLMATPYNVHFDVTKSPGRTHSNNLRPESAEKASELLMLNHAKYHTYFNEFGLHSMPDFL